MDYEGHINHGHIRHVPRNPKADWGPNFYVGLLKIVGKIKFKIRTVYVA